MTAAAAGAVAPPPIGDALRLGWQTFQRDMAAIAVAMFCAMLLALIPLLGGGLALAGMMHVALKALRGQTPAAADGFIGLSDNAVDHIVMGLLQIVGLVACCIGAYVSQAIFYPGTLMILERGMGWEQAKDECLARVKPNWGAWTVFTLAVTLVGGSGALLCGIGVLFTAPIAMIALAYGYQHAFGGAPAR
jgi:hypothetical protein